MDPVATSSTSLKVKKSRKRSNKKKQKRRNREKGPHPCLLCDHAPFKSISELRAHVIGVHRKHCSWTKQIRDVKPADVTEAPQPAHDINGTEVRGLHVSRPSAVVTGNGYDFDNDEHFGEEHCICC